MKKYFDVVIPVHDSSHWLAGCLEEFFRFDSGNLRSVYVVNDRSEPSQSKKIQQIVKRYPQRVQLIENTGPEGGFGFACNLGVSRCTSDLVLFLNTDCFVTSGVVDKLAGVFNSDERIVLACPISNNSPTLTYPMFPGRSYRDMASMIDTAFFEHSDESIVEVCTVVGNCLFVEREFFNSVGGFSPEWGIGYGEETDLQMKAFAKGLKGVAHLGCYVYHYGGGTFNYEREIEDYRTKNHALFLKKWGESYLELELHCSKIAPLERLSDALTGYGSADSKIIELDVLFYLPCIDQGIGGINAVVAICNELIRNGIKACCALVGPSANEGRASYKEPVLFNFIDFSSDIEFLNDRCIVTKIALSTIFTSASIVSQFAAERSSLAIQFVQGYEGYFYNGECFLEALSSYGETKNLITTSRWLCEMVGRHLGPDQSLTLLPLVVNEDIYFPGCSDRDIDVCVVLRSSSDKGQWLIIEVLDRLRLEGFSITVLCSQRYENLRGNYEAVFNFIPLPLDQYAISNVFRRTKVFLDLSLHEGFGLMPLEAAMCGCAVIASDSGGISEFADSFDVEICGVCSNPDSYVTRIQNKIHDFEQGIERVLFRRSEAGLAWSNYFKDRLSGINPKRLHLDDASLICSDLQSSPQAADLQSSPQAGLKDRAIAMMSSLFKKIIGPYMPVRIKMALKILIFGKL